MASTTAMGLRATTTPTGSRFTATPCCATSATTPTPCASRWSAPCGTSSPTTSAGTRSRCGASGCSSPATLHGRLKCVVTEHADPRIDLLSELADPVRLRVVDRLGAAGPATVSELAGELRVSMSQLSNHLRRLREAGLVRVERNGRHGGYEIADPGRGFLTPMPGSVPG